MSEFTEIQLSDAARSAAQERKKKSSRARNAKNAARLAELVKAAGDRLDTSRAEAITAALKEDDGEAADALGRCAVQLRPRTKRKLTSQEDAVNDLIHSWDTPAPFAATGLPGLDRILNGGLRGGNVLGIAGAAKAGKSALVGQISYDAAGPNVISVYASVEMPRREVWARWITREVFRLALEDGHGESLLGPIANFGEVFHGNAFRRGRRAENDDAVQMHVRLESASKRAKARPNLYVEHIPPCSTPWDLRELVRDAREDWSSKHEPGTPMPLAVLVVDPVQRLFAGESGALMGSSLARINADEIARMGQVAQQLKVMADEDQIAIIFPSDGTKSGAAAGPQQVTDFRGSYQLNHLATTILGLTTRKPDDPGDPTSAAKALAEALDKNAAEKRAKDILNQMPRWWDRWARTGAALRFGPRPVAIDCSGNRQGDQEDLVLGFVRGACAFFEQEGDNLGTR